MVKIFDAHCDTGFELLEQNQKLKKNSLHLDLCRMEEYDAYFQVFASFIDQKNINCSPFNHCMATLEKLRDEISNNFSSIMMIKSACDMDIAEKENKVGAILSIEGGEALEGSLENLKTFYNLGVRLITLTWNYANEIADGITEERGNGLTEFGKKLITAMNDMGIIIDVSHLSVNGFWDVAELSTKPFIASHSCVKALCGHPRNLDDEQIEFLISHNCGIGINFYPDFLTENKRCDITDIIRHFDYILNMGGESSLGLGSDFDGVPYLPDGISGTESMKDIILAMKNSGYTDDIVENICFNNFYRLLHKILEN